MIVGRAAPKGNQIYARQVSASGLAAVWARENTREALWDAMARKEVYATTGTRMVVRVFGGFDFTAKDLARSDFAEQGYARGVPMGGDLKAAPAGKAPAFVIRAVRDPDGANLDRIQVVKGWLDAAGKTHEKIYDVAWSGPRKPGKDGQAPAGRQHGERQGSIVHERDRRAVPDNVLEGPTVQREGARVLLRPRAGDPDAALDDIRRQVFRRRAAEGRAREHPGARLHLADLVYAGSLTMEFSSMKNLMREPLLHFLLLGALIFVAFKFISRETSEPGKILITQGRIESLETAFSRTWRRPPSRKRIGRLDPRLRSRRSFRARSGRPRSRKDDTIIRRRLRQKLEFISEDVFAHAEPTDEQLHAYLKEHPDTFRGDRRFTFSQVYLDPQQRGANLNRDAAQVLAQLASIRQ